jgi:hypothetical protein
MNIDNPTEQEVEDFFVPLFFGDSGNCLNAVLMSHRRNPEKKSCETLETASNKKTKVSRGAASVKVYKLKQSGKITKSRSNLAIKKALKMSPDEDLSRSSSKHFDTELRGVNVESLCTLCGSAEKKKRLSLILTELLQRSGCHSRRKSPNERSRNLSLVQNYGDSGGWSVAKLPQIGSDCVSDVDKQKIYSLWRRTVLRTSKDMPVAHLEVLYDTIAACIAINRDSFQYLVQVRAKSSLFLY